MQKYIPVLFATLGAIGFFMLLPNIMFRKLLHPKVHRRLGLYGRPIMLIGFFGLVFTTENYRVKLAPQPNQAIFFLFLLAFAIVAWALSRKKTS